MRDPRTPGWTRTLPMPLLHSQKGWSLLLSAKRFWRPLVVRPRTTRGRQNLFAESRSEEVLAPPCGQT